MSFDAYNANLFGHVLIRDKHTHETLMDKYNQIHFENMAIALSRSLSNKNNGPIYEMAFGNGAATVDNLGVITYLQPNAVGINATLYNETYSKIVDDNSPQNTNNQLNNIVVQHEDGKVYSDIIVTCTLDFGEPAGQFAFDDTTDFESTFTFDELGLKTQGNPEYLISHVVFHPVQKSLNRQIEIIYTIRNSIA